MTFNKRKLLRLEQLAVEQNERLSAFTDAYHEVETEWAKSLGEVLGYIFDNLHEHEKLLRKIIDTQEEILKRTERIK